MPRIAPLLLALAVVGSALAMGSVDTVVLFAVACVVALATFFAWRPSDPVVPRRSATIIVFVALGLVIFTTVQCIPMPRSVVAALSPHAADVWSRCLRPLGEEGPSVVTLSLDPTATRVEVIRGVVYLLTFLGALRVAWRREGAVALERTLVAASALITLVAAVHYGLGLDSVYGFYRPRTEVSSIAPFFNSNHLAAYANIGLLLCFASLLSRAPLMSRALLGAAVLLLGAAELRYASRGGVGAMLVGMVVIALMAARSKATRLVSVALPATVALAGVALLVLGAAPNAILGLADTDVSKLDITRQVLVKMAPAYPWFGSGRGTFEQTFPEFREGTQFIVWSHPENLVAQWISEWGVVVGVVALAALAYALRPRAAVSRSHPAIGPWAVLVAVVLQNLVDFNMEIPAVSVSLAVCAALVVAGSGEASRAPAAFDRWSSRPRVVAAAALVAMVPVAGLTFARRAELLDDRAAIHDVPIASVNGDVARARLRRAMLDHPAEPYFPYVGAAWALTARDGNVVPWIDRTLERAPVYPPAHLVLARWLRRRSPAQARLEYRIYDEQTGGQVEVREVAPLVGSFDDALELTPSGMAGAPLLEALSVTIAERLPATQARIDAEILLRDPRAKEPTLRATQRAVSDVAGAPWCEVDPRPCIEEALVLAQRAEKIAPTRCVGFAAHARLLYVRGDTRAALDLLKSAADAVLDRAECERTLAELATEAGRYDDATEAIDALSRTPCGVDVTCVENLLLAAQLEDARHSGNRALVFLRLAAKAAPDNEDVASSLAARASVAGLHAEAGSVYLDLASKHPGNPEYRTLAEQERSRALSAPQ